MLNRVYAAIDGFLNSSALSPDPDVTRQAYICNLCALIGAVGTSIFLLLYVVMDAALFGPIILVSLVLIPSFGIAILFNRRGWFESAKIAMFSSGFAVLINGSWMLGGDSGVHLILLSFPVLAGQMWARQRLEITVPFTVLSGAVVAVLHAATGVGLLGPIPESYSIVFLTASISIALLLLFFTQYQSLYRMDVVTANLQKALDYMPGAIMAGNERGDVIFVNEQTNRLFNLPEGHVKEGSSLYWALDEMLKAGANHTDEGVEYTIDEVYAMFASRDTVPLTVQHTDGRFLEVVIAPTPSGGFVAVATDISGRINAIRDAQDQRMIAEQVLDNMGEGILMVDGEGKVAAFNRRVSEYYEMTPEEVRRSRGQDYEEMLSYVYLEKYNLPERLETVLASVRRGDSFSDDDVLPDGRIIEVRQRLMAAGGFVKMYLDVTESRQAAAELSRQKEIANQALENMG